MLPDQMVEGEEEGLQEHLVEGVVVVEHQEGVGQEELVGQLAQEELDQELFDDSGEAGVVGVTGVVGFSLDVTAVDDEDDSG